MNAVTAPARSVSIIVPVYNEGRAAIFAAQAAIEAAMAASAPRTYEIVFVDDGSTDDSFLALANLAARSPHVRVLRLAANAGGQLAVRAGLAEARGDTACYLACDLQEPASLVPAMCDALTPPVEIVWAVRERREDPRMQRVFARIFYEIARVLVSRKVRRRGTGSYLLGPLALRLVNACEERNLVLEGMLVDCGLPQAEVSYMRAARTSGASRWTLARRLKLFADYFSQSYVPIRLISLAGLVAATSGFVYALFVIANRLLFGEDIVGWSSLIAVVLVIGGLQMTMIGVMGEYVWRTLDEVRGRPRHLVHTRLNDARGLPASAAEPFAATAPTAVPSTASDLPQ